MDVAALDRADAMKRDFNDEWPSSGFVKMLLDGVLDSHTAFMLNDYPNSPGDRGEPVYALERFYALCK